MCRELFQKDPKYNRDDFCGEQSGLERRFWGGLKSDEYNCLQNARFKIGGLSTLCGSLSTLTPGHCCARDAHRISEQTTSERGKRLPVPQVLISLVTHVMWERRGSEQGLSAFSNGLAQALVWMAPVGPRANIITVTHSTYVTLCWCCL